MDIKTYLKTASLNELKNLEVALRQEMKSRSGKVTKRAYVATYTDGAARGNPGPAACGILIFSEEGEELLRDGRTIGETTNNEAEYRALIFALDRAIEFTNLRVDCYLDSELVVRQLNGQYALKAEKLVPFFRDVKSRVENFAEVTFTHVPREHPRLALADQLANKALDDAKKINKN